MLTVLLSFVAIALAVLGFSAATVAGKRPVRTPCHELAERAGDTRSCPVCGEPPKR